MSDSSEQASTAPLEEQVSSASGAFDERPRVLIVEDNPSTQYLLQNLLEDQYEVSAAVGAQEAMRLADRETPFDVVLMDIQLGGGNSGTEVMKQLRRQAAYKETPIAAVTAYALPGDEKAFLEAGFDAYLSKPFTARKLRALVAELLPSEAAS